MKKYLLFGAFMVFTVFGYGQGSESFDNASFTSNYGTGNYTGDGGLTWFYTTTRSASLAGYEIDGEGALLRRESDNSKVLVTATGGISEFTCDLKKAFTGSGNRQAELWVNNSLIATSGAFDDTQTHSFDVSGINISGSVTIEVRNTRSTQIVVDNIIWLDFIPLPIDLTSFTATQKNKQVSLAWQTATEINNDYFTIERSANGQRFEAIGKVNGAGNSTTELRYEFVDNTPMRGTNYYRLTQTDYDGQFETFDAVSVDYKVGGSATINPTKVSDIMTLSVEPMQTVGRVAIYSMVGQKIYDEAIDAGSSNMEIDAVGFAPGLYVARISNGSFVETVRFIKQ